MSDTQIEPRLRAAAAAGDPGAARKLLSLYGQRGEDAPAEVKDVADVAELETVDLKGVDLMAANVRAFGSGAADKRGEFYDAEALTRLAADSNAVVDEARPANKIGHDKAQRLARASGLSDGEMPALGYLRNFRYEDGKLKGDVLRVPKKFAGLLKSGAFRTRSVEVSPFKSQATGESYKTVIRGLAWLGAKAPAFRTLDDVYALYAGDAKVAGTAELLYADEEPDGDVETLDYVAEEWQVVTPAAPPSTVTITPSTDSDAPTDTRAQMPETLTKQEADAKAKADLDAKAKADADAAEKVEIPKAELSKLAESLGLPADADMAKVTEAAAELKTKADAEPEPAPTPEGVKQMTEDEYAELKLMAEDGKTAKEQLRVIARETVLRDAMKDGKFDPADLEEWRKDYDANGEMVKSILSRVPENDKFKTYGEDDDGNPDIDRNAMSEKQYQEYCELMGIEYRAPAEEAVS